MYFLQIRTVYALFHLTTGCSGCYGSSQPILRCKCIAPQKSRDAHMTRDWRWWLTALSAVRRKVKQGIAFARQIFHANSQSRMSHRTIFCRSHNFGHKVLILLSVLPLRKMRISFRHQAAASATYFDKMHFNFLGYGSMNCPPIFDPITLGRTVDTM